MSKPMLSFVIAVFFALPCGAEELPAGAKELFYDPSGSVASVAARRTAPRTDRAPRQSGRPAEAGLRRPLILPASEAPAASKVLGLSYWIELETPGSPAGIQVTDRRTFKSGERIRLHFCSNSPGYVSLLQLGSSGTGQILFPNPSQGLGDASLKAGKERILPSEDHWFVFDGNPGTEKLIVLFAKDRSELVPSAAPIGPNLPENEEMIRLASNLRGSKDLLIEWEDKDDSQIGTYGVNLSGQPVMIEISLVHD